MIALVGWINGMVDLTGKQVDYEEGPKQNLDGWLNYNDQRRRQPCFQRRGGIHRPTADIL